MNLLARPLGALLKLIFDITSNYGLSIILFTLAVKLLTIPLTIKQTKSMKEMQEVQPKLKKLQEKYKNDKEKLNIKTMELYKEHNISPLGGCLPLLIQFPILIGLFAAIREPGVYVFQSQAAYEAINTSFLWMENLANPDQWILPIIVGLTTYLSSATMSAKGGPADSSQKVMMYFMPILLFWWGRSFPAGLTLYLTVSNAFQVIQQLIIRRPQKELKEGLK